MQLNQNKLLDGVRQAFIEQFIGNLNDKSLISKKIMKSITNQQKLNEEIIKKGVIGFDKICKEKLRDIDKLLLQFKQQQTVFSYQPKQKSSKLLPYFQQFKSTKVQPFSYFNIETKTPQVIEDILLKAFKGDMSFNASDVVKQQILQMLNDYKNQRYTPILQNPKVTIAKVIQLEPDKVQVEGEFIASYVLFDSNNKIMQGGMQKQKRSFSAEIGNNNKVESLKTDILSVPLVK